MMVLQMRQKDHGDRKGTMGEEPLYVQARKSVLPSIR